VVTAQGVPTRTARRADKRHALGHAAQPGVCRAGRLSARRTRPARPSSQASRRLRGQRSARTARGRKPEQWRRIFGAGRCEQRSSSALVQQRLERNQVISPATPSVRRCCRESSSVALWLRPTTLFRRAARTGNCASTTLSAPTGPPPRRTRLARPARPPGELERARLDPGPRTARGTRS